MNGQRGRAVSGAFVFLLLGVFAVFATLLVLLGARAYRFAHRLRFRWRALR